MTNNGRMGERSPISSIVIRGRVGPVGSFSGTEKRGEPAISSKGSMLSTDAVGALGGRVGWPY